MRPGTGKITARNHGGGVDTRGAGGVDTRGVGVIAARDLGGVAARGDMPLPA